jgi:glycosyltransferase involved in cell wall biosynthesis
MNGTIELSVLMSTWAGDTPEFARVAIASVLNQSLKPDEVIIVKDGPVPPALGAVLESYRLWPGVKLVELSECTGLANALNTGLCHCSGEFVARMDADDISLPQRFEIQVGMLRTRHDLSLVASWHGEFRSSEPDKIVATKRAPSNHEDIVRALRWRCVLSHPTIMVSRAALEKVGGYRTCVGKLEDWDLYMRLLNLGYRMTVVPQILVKVRVDPVQRGRRSGLKHILPDWRFKWDCLRRGDLRIWEWAVSTTAWIGFRILPRFVKVFGYKYVRD